MKRFLKYLYKHFTTVLTLLATIITSIALNCSSKITVDLVDNFLIASIISLNLTFLFDFTRNIDSINNKINEFKKTIPSSRIESFESVDQVAEKLFEIINDGNHKVDMVLYDTQIRTSDLKKVNKMQKFISYCSKNKKIKLRLAFVPAKDSICQKIDSIIESEKKHSNSYYAYQESSITFASFMIIDDIFVSVRTPHKNGSKSLYCVIEEDNLCLLYSSWFSLLWEEACHINGNNLIEFIKKYKNIISNDRIDNYIEKAEDLKNG